MSFRNLPKLLQVYLILIVALGVATLLALAKEGQVEQPKLLGLLLLCSVGVSTLKVELTIKGGRMTVNSAIVCLAMLLEPRHPIASVLCAGIGAIAGTFARPVPGRLLPRFVWDPQYYRPVFNAAICMLAAALAACGYDLTFDTVSRIIPAPQNGTLPGGPIAALVAGAMVFQTIQFLVNTVGVSIALALANRQRVAQIWRDNFLWTAAGYYATASIAILISLLFTVKFIGWFGLILLPAVYFCYYSYRIYMERMNLYVSKVEQDMRHIQELNELNSAIIASLATAIDAKDRYTRSHINRVQLYAVGLAEAVGLSGPDLEAVRTGALIHDIGKLGIPERILGKPGKLTPEEYRRMQAHVTIGAEILAPVRFPYPVLPIVETHHERWDGLGYPRGLKGEEIPIGGRIMAIADVFDALTSNRPYRRAMSHEEAVGVLREGAARHFDPNLVQRFAEILPEVRVRVEEMEAKIVVPVAGAAIAEAEPNWAFSLISQAAAEMSATCELAQGLAETSTVQEVLSVVIDRALALLPADTAVVYLCRNEGIELEAAKIGGLYQDKLAGLTINRGEGVSGWVAETLQPQINAQASLDIARRFNPNEVMELSAAAAVPLVQGGDTLGVLSLYTTGYTVLHEHHLGVLNVLAEHAAAALVSARRYEQTRELSLTDPLTGLPNSRSLIHHIDTLRNRTTGQGFAVLMFDLDGFKSVNDLLGHLRGDEVLREFGEILRGLCREQDLPCRYAGDEFVVVLRDVDETYAREFGASVRDSLDQRCRQWLSLSIGVSVGAAFFPVDGREVKNLLAVADERMYSDKFSRRGSLTEGGEPLPSSSGRFR